jgi:hypothetical protein
MNNRVAGCGISDFAHVPFGLRLLRLDMQKLPKALKQLLAEIAADFPKLLGDSLVGIYVTGSISYASFNEKSSDADLVVLLERHLDRAQFGQLSKWFRSAARSNTWLKRTEIMFLIKENLLVKNTKQHELQDGLLKRCLYDANAILLLNMLETGIVLHGPKPKSFIPKISQELMRNSLRLETRYLRKGIREHTLTYQVYAALTLCRILYTCQTAKIASKEYAGRWCCKQLPRQWQPVVKAALKNVHVKSRRSNALLKDALPGFVEYIDRQIAA